MTGDRVLDAREVPLGGIRGLSVQRTLPHRALPTVGAWCFVDHFGPTREPMTVLPHPHTGLQTVTWPLSGDIRHRDSLGHDVVLRPGELNLMTSGDGVAHSEFSVEPEAMLHGLQLWVALPDGPRTGAAAFEHHALLPHAGGPGWSATVLLGDLDGATSPAVAHTPIVGAELTVRPDPIALLPLRPDFEHAVLAVDGPMTIDGTDLPRGQMRYLAPGRSSVNVQVTAETTALLIGGEPFVEPLVMWWNFIGRSHEDIEQARREWERADPRFGHVLGHDGQVIPAPPLPQVRLKPRRGTVVSDTIGI